MMDRFPSLSLDCTTHYFSFAPVIELWNEILNPSFTLSLEVDNRLLLRTIDAFVELLRLHLGTEIITDHNRYRSRFSELKIIAKSNLIQPHF